MGNLCCCKDTPNITLSCDNNGMVNSCCAGESRSDGNTQTLYKWVCTVRHKQRAYRYESHVWYNSLALCHSEAIRHMRVWTNNPDSSTRLHMFEWSVETVIPSRLIKQRTVTQSE